MSKPFVIGITGTIGSGKSAVGHILEDIGVPVIDSDKVVHELFATNLVLKDRLVAEFGPTVISDGSSGIDRKALGRIVFSDPKAREQLEDIVHPLTIEACLRELAKYSNEEIVAILVPLLFEAAPHLGYDAIWAVTTNEETLIKRLINRDNMTIDQAKERLAAQFSQEKKAQGANNVIDNSSTLEYTRDQVVSLIDQIKNPRHA